METKIKPEEQKHDTENEALPDDVLDKVSGGNTVMHLEPVKERPAWMNDK